MMKIQKKLIACLSIVMIMIIGFMSPATALGMKRPQTGTFLEESPDITQYKDIQYVISQKFQQFPMIQNAIQFLAWEPITLKNTGGINFVATNGDIVVTGSEDGTVKTWNAATGEQLITYAAHNGPVRQVAISGDIIVSKSDNTVNIWKTNGKFLHTFKYFSFSKIVISDDKLAIPSSDKIDILKTNGELLRTLIENSPVRTLIMRGHKVITRSMDNTAKIWDINTGKLLHTLAGRIDVAISGDKVVTGSSDNSAKIWDINTGKLLRTLEGHTDTVWSVATSGDKVVTGSNDKTAKIWDINTGQVLHTLKWPLYQIISIIVTGNKVVISLYNEFALDGYVKRTVNVYDINTGKLLHTFVVGWTSPLAEIETANDTMITITRDNIANIWGLAQRGDNIVRIWALDPFKGTPETNPLQWIINNATVPQLDFIKRAYEATVAIDDQELIIAFPSEDAKVFLSFPTHVKQYLLARLKIRR